jgi:hypothetical protein
LRSKSSAAGPSATEPKPAPSAAFNYSWRTGATLAALTLTLAIFLALPFRADVEALRIPRWVFSAVALGSLPATLDEALSANGGWPAMRDRLFIAGNVLLAFAFAGSVGLSVLLFGFRPRELGEIETCSLAGVLGLAALSLVTFVSTLVGALGQPGWSFVLTLVLLPFCLTALAAAMRRRFQTKHPQSPPPRPEFPVSLWLIVGLPATALALLLGALPPYEFDVLEYHFPVPKEWHAEGMTRTEGNVYGAMPQGAEMFVLWGMDSGGENGWWRGALVGKTILALFIPLASLLAASIAGRIAGRGAGLFAGWTALTVPWLWSVGTSGLVEHVWGVYFLAAAWTAFRTWFRDATDPDAVVQEPIRDRTVPVAEPVVDRLRSAVGEWRLRATPSLRWAALTGAFFGAACACKYPALPLIGAPLILFHVACFVIASRREKGVVSGSGESERTRASEASTEEGAAGQASHGTRMDSRLAVFVKATAIVGVVALLFGGGWYLKNAVLYGNPVFPLATTASGDAGWREELQANWAKAHRVPGETAWERWSPVSFAGSAWTWLMATSGVGPLLSLGLVALALAKRPPRPIWILLAMAGGFFLLFWLLTHRIERFFVPSYPLLAVAAGVGFAAGASSFQRSMRQVTFWLGLAWCLVVIGFSFVDERLLQSLDRLRTGGQIEGVEPRIPPAVQWLNANVKQGRALAIGDVRVFDYTVPVLYHTCFDESPLQVLYDEAKHDPASLRERLNAEGISYVYVHWGEIERYRSPGNYGFPFPVVTPSQFDKLVDDGVLLPPVVVGPRREESGSDLWEIYPVAPDEANAPLHSTDASPPSTEAER